MPNLENGEENAENNASDTDDEEDNSAFDHMVSLNDKITYALSAQFDLTVTIDMMKCPIKTEDENTIFCTALRSLSQRSPQDINDIISGFSPENKSKVTDLLSKTQFKFVDKQGQVQQVQRKIVRVKRRGGANGPSPGVPTVAQMMQTPEQQQQQ